METKSKKNLPLIITILVLVILSCSFLIYKYVKENNAWELAKTTNTTDSYRVYLQTYPTGKYVEDSKHKIDSTLWANALKINKYEAYKLYVDSSYFKLYTQQADSLEQLVLLNEATKTDLYEDYQRYLDIFPNGTYSEKVNDILDTKLWEKTIKDGYVASYKRYLERLPKGKNIESANNFLSENLWQAAINQNSKSLYQQYISKYPNGTHIDEAKSQFAYYQAVENEQRAIQNRNSNPYYKKGFKDGETDAFEREYFMDYAAKTYWRYRHNEPAPRTDQEKANFSEYERGYSEGWDYGKGN